MTSKLLDAIEVVLCLFFAGVMVFLMITALRDGLWDMGKAWKGVFTLFHKQISICLSMTIPR